MPLPLFYGPDAQDARQHAWDADGRMDLVHDNLGENLKDGDSATVVYYVAFGIGDKQDATDLAEDVTKEPAEEAVSPEGSLTTTWGRIRVGN